LGGAALNLIYMIHKGGWLLQSVAVCCSLMQSVACLLYNDSDSPFLYVHVLQSAGQVTSQFLCEYIRVLQRVAVCCSVLQCVAVCWSCNEYVSM